MQFLVAPVKWTNTMAIKRLTLVGCLRESWVRVTLKQREPIEEERQLSRGPQWERPAGGSGVGLRHQERGQPVVVAFQNTWGRDDIRRHNSASTACCFHHSVPKTVADLRAVERWDQPQP